MAKERIVSGRNRRQWNDHYLRFKVVYSRVLDDQLDAARRELAANGRSMSRTQFDRLCGLIKRFETV